MVQHIIEFDATVEEAVNEGETAVLVLAPNSKVTAIATTSLPKGTTVTIHISGPAEIVPPERALNPGSNKG
jgi:predicted short-subunit dehydrogenase-like oxidoreductase (DUF2520 family)